MLNPFDTPFVIFSAFLSLIAAFRLFDSIIKYLVMNRHDEWEELDRPSGLFWKPDSMKTEIPKVARKGLSLGFCASANRSGSKLMVHLVFKTPLWAKADRSVRIKIFVLRIFIIYWWIFCFGMLIFGVFGEIAKMYLA